MKRNIFAMGSLEDPVGLCKVVVWVAASYLTQVCLRITFGRGFKCLYGFNVIMVVSCGVLEYFLCDYLLRDSSYTFLYGFYQKIMKSTS